MFRSRTCWSWVIALAAACSASSQPESERDAALHGGGDDGGHDAGSLSDAAASPGATIDAPWEWVEVEGTVCRNGSVAGFHINRDAASRELLIYLEGGGACYDAQTCAGNPDSTWQLPPVGGLFAREQVLNPVADWSFVYIPYCSGDHYIGDARDVEVPGVPGVQQFQGRRNTELMLERIVEAFGDTERVVLSGTSAGGIGTLMSYRLVQKAFGSTPVIVIDDSGPLLSKDHVAPCLAELRRGLWGIERTVLEDCGDHCKDEDSWQLDYALYNIESIPRASGLVTSLEDWILRAFIGIGSNDGKNDCLGSLETTPIDSAAFTAGLLDLRERIRERAPRFSTFYPSSLQHGWLVFPGLYSQTAGADGVTMIDWVRGILDEAPATHIGP